MISEEDAVEVSKEVIPNLTEWATQADINRHDLKQEIIAYMTAIGSIAIDSKANVSKRKAVAFFAQHGKYNFRVVVERSLRKTPKGQKI